MCIRDSGFDDQAARLSLAILDQIEGQSDASTSFHTHKLRRVINPLRLEHRAVAAEENLKQKRAAAGLEGPAAAFHPRK